MHIAILGGAFDPPHIGHQLVAQQAGELLGADEVWFMVCPQYFPEFPIKYAKISSFDHRQAMTAFLQTDKVKISDFEQKNNPQGWTVNTLALLRQQFPQHTFTWIIGSDQVRTFQLWNRWQKIVQEYNLAVFPRDTNFETLEERVKNYFQLSTIPKNIIICKDPEIVVSNISSSLIRKRIRKGLPISHFVKKEVEEYIYKNKLYS